MIDWTSIGGPSTVVRALALALVPILSAIPADAEPFTRIDTAAFCRSMQAINVLPGTYEQKYEGCLDSQRIYLRGLEEQWGFLSEEKQRRCVTQFVPEGGYLGLAWCVWETTRRTFR
jgi:hypothetical protein